jgi:hypothetical protein
MMRRTLSALLVTAALFLPGTASSQTVSVFGSVGLQTISSDAPRPWIDGGFGRLQGGTDGDESADETLVGELNLGIEWLSSRDMVIFAHGLARGESRAREKWSGGIVEAWGERTFRLDSINETRIRAGTMILPTSRENTGELWSSPYLVSFSAINSWIAEEVRPTGVDIQYKRDDGSRSFRLAGTAFVANDTPGTLLAWRGWAIGNRLTTFGEELPLPPLHSLPDSFASQKPGTTPYGDELDGRIGWAARARYDLWNRLTVQATHYDNRGDRELHSDEYAWRTRFDLFAIELSPGGGLTLISEVMRGSTLMGPASGARVEADFGSVYVLASWARCWLRVSGRYDRFSTTDRDFSAAENNDEDGESLAIAIAVAPSPAFRAALEFLEVDVQRLASLESGAPLQNGGDAILFHLRLSF